MQGVLGQSVALLSPSLPTIGSASSQYPLSVSLPANPSMPMALLFSVPR